VVHCWVLTRACVPPPMGLQNVLAKMVIDRVPSVEMVRFCSSGTEVSGRAGRQAAHPCVAVAARCGCVRATTPIRSPPLVALHTPTASHTCGCPACAQACLSVLRLMRAYTKREKIIKFVGAWPRTPCTLRSHCHVRTALPHQPLAPPPSQLTTPRSRHGPQAATTATLTASW